jgi:hypothetical protein
MNHLQRVLTPTETDSSHGGSNDRIEAVPGRRKWWFFGKRKTKLIAICLDCWAEMDFVGTV